MRAWMGRGIGSWALLALVSCSPPAIGPAPPSRAGPEPTQPWQERDAAQRPAQTRARTRPAPDPAGPSDEPALQALPVAGHHPAWVSLPTSDHPQPTVFVAHGAGGDPRWHCAHWRALLEKQGALVCLSGDWIGPGESHGYYFRDHRALRAELLAALEAVRAEFGERVDTAQSVFLGYSQGATMGAHAVVPHAHLFSRLVLIEGGASAWNVARGIRFREGGGQRVLFVCGTSGCERDARRSEQWLTRARVNTRVAHVHRGGHTPAGRVGAAVAEQLDWLLAGDSRWQPWPTHSSPGSVKPTPSQTPM